MSSHRSRGVVALAAVGGLLAIATPAIGADVNVTLTSTPGSRQFAVQDLTGVDLTAINLGSGGQQPFRTVVTDSTFQNVTQGYTVSAKMNNLYLHTGSPLAAQYATKVPSSEVSLQYGTSPLSALGVDLSVLPKITLGGTLESCSDLGGPVKTALGLSALGVVLDGLDTSLISVCSALSAVDGTAVTGTVDGALQQITPVINSLADLPTALTGATPGPFTNADYSNGVGAGDTAGAADAPAATSLGIMTGTPGLSASLSTQIKNQLDTALGSLPLASVTGAGAQTTVGAVITALSSSATAGVAAVGTALSTLDSARQVTLVNTLTGTVAVPVLGDLKSLSGQYYAFPILKATPTTPVPGVYRGTMTVTFVQS